ncbi:hypothetical protein cyc_01277 [Cyclospora cayetanensis]|uniref:J domain-containing protein n=1 Tax=Cyclospora cayetanensis TaxID=88456 RepID=A0A1D3CX21_9EIME|nr:hypothetical protein cyc_01277 [Cyclospora cayetanensis]
MEGEWIPALEDPAVSSNCSSLHTAGEASLTTVSPCRGGNSANDCSTSSTEGKQIRSRICAAGGNVCSASVGVQQRSQPSSAASAHTSKKATTDAELPPLAAYWGSPFSYWNIWGVRLEFALAYLFGGFLGLPAAGCAALLPQQLLRLFTFGGCGLLLLYDCVFGVRWVYTRVLEQRQQRWVQRQLDLLLSIHPKETRKAVAEERLRLGQLVSALCHHLAAAHEPSCHATAAAASKWQAEAADSGAASAAMPTAQRPLVGEEDSPPLAEEEANAAAQRILAGDLKAAARLYGVSPDAVAAAVAAAQLHHAESCSSCRRKRQSSPWVLRTAAGVSKWLWRRTKDVVTFCCCFVLVVVFTLLPLDRFEAVLGSSGWSLPLPWLLPLLHAFARACLAAAFMNLHVGEYASLAVLPAVPCAVHSRSSGAEKHCGCVLERPPKQWNVHWRLLFAFLVPLLCSLVTTAAWSAAAANKFWSYESLVAGLPHVLVGLPLQLLPSEISSILPLHEERVRATEYLLLLVQEQKALGWLQWPKTDASRKMLSAGVLLTVAAAAAARCSIPPALWEQHARLEQAAGILAARKLLHNRAQMLRHERLCSRISKRCRWAWEGLVLSVHRVPLGVVSRVRCTCVSVLALLWVLVLLVGTADVPVGWAEDGVAITPLSMLQERMQQDDLKQAWLELKALHDELQRRVRVEGYERTLEWMLQQVQASWNEQIETEKKDTEALAGALKLFNLGNNATIAEIKHRYRQLARRHHPDRAGVNAGKRRGEGCLVACEETSTSNASRDYKARHEFMQNINLAYEVLLEQAGGKAPGW